MAYTTCKHCGAIQEFADKNDCERGHCDRCGREILLNDMRRNIAESSYRMRNVTQPKEKFSRSAAAIISVFMPGVGHMCAGSVGAGLVLLMVTILCYLLFFPLGIVMHIVCVVTAANL
jgi:TM2 domain-containing membrane protein YozV